MNDTDLKLIFKYIYNDCSPEEAAQFNERMKDPEFMDLYANMVLDAETYEWVLSEERTVAAVESAPASRSKILSFPALAAAACLMMAVGLSFFFLFGFKHDLGISHGVVSIERGSERIELSRGAIEEGDILSSSGNSISLSYRDGTSLRILPYSKVKIVSFMEQKKLKVLEGEVRIKAMKQEKPMLCVGGNSTAEVLGTILYLKTGEREDSLGVAEGKVLFRNKAGNEIFVDGGKMAVADQGEAFETYPVTAWIDEPGKAFHRWRAASDGIRQDDALRIYYDFQDDEFRRGILPENKSVADRRLISNEGSMEILSVMGGRVGGKKSVHLNKESRFVMDHLRSGRFRNTFTFIVTFKESEKAGAWPELISRNIMYSIGKSEKTGGLRFSCGFNDDGGHGVLKRYELDGRTAIEPEKWYQAAFVKTKTSMKVYLNGVLEAEVPVEGFLTRGIQFNHDIFLGKHDELSAKTPHAGFEGWLDELMIFARDLSPEEIKSYFAESGIK